MCTKKIEVKSKKGHSKANPEEMIFFTIRVNATVFNYKNKMLFF